MYKSIFKYLSQKLEYILIILLIFFTIIFTSFYYQKQNSFNKNINNLIDNVYLEKTVNNILNNFKPRYLKIEHEVSSGESFLIILENYKISKIETNEVLKILKKHINLKNIKTSDYIKLTIDQSKKKLIKFSYKISKNKIINLTNNLKTNTFNEEIITTKLTKKLFIKKILFLIAYTELHKMKVSLQI